MFIKPVSADNWRDLPALAADVDAPAWEDTLRKVQSVLAVAIKEFHYQINGGIEQNFPSAFGADHAFWTWFLENGTQRLYRMIDDLPETYDRALAERIVRAAVTDGIVFGAG